MKLKILIATSAIDINIIRSIKDNYEITYNEDDLSVHIIINDDFITLRDYPDYKVEYKHFIESQNTMDIPFIIELTKQAYLELSSMSF